MIQTHEVIKRLQKHWPDIEITIEQIRTQGDHITDVPLTQIGGDGVFVTEIEHALRAGRIDLATHSLKDLPTTQPDDLRIVVVGPREDVRDVIVWNEAVHSSLRLNGIAWGTGNQEAASPSQGHPLHIGTCSLRRTAQILAHWPDAQILPLRGNVDTRLRKLDAGEYDGIVLAAAGLHRLEMQERLAGRITYLPIDVMMPAPGQAALALEIRDQPEMHTLVAPLKDLAAAATTSAERAFMRRLGAGCYLPVAAYGEIVDEMLTVQGLVISLDGRHQVRAHQSIEWTRPANVELAEQLGIQLAEQALFQGANEIIHAIDATKVQEHSHV
jgi:hydroxymethylbilane synthase